MARRSLRRPHPEPDARAPRRPPGQQLVSPAVLPMKGWRMPQERGPVNVFVGLSVVAPHNPRTGFANQRFRSPPRKSAHDPPAPRDKNCWFVGPARSKPQEAHRKTTVFANRPAASHPGECKKTPTEVTSVGVICARCRIRTYVGASRRIYSPLPLAARAIWHALLGALHTLL